MQIMLLEENMDLLYRLFYTVFSMAAVTGIMMPVILVLRFLLLKAPKKYIIYLWLLLFLRGICPVSLSSPVCLIKPLNRWFHKMLSQTGIDIKDNTGIMKGWLAVFNNDISVNTSYKACTLIWCAGIAGICIFTLVRQANILPRQNITQVYGRIYQAAGLKSPLIKGVFFLRQYIPADIRANDVKYLLQHFEVHKKRKDGIKRFFAFVVLVVQWFNPLLWIAYYLLAADIEMAADEEAGQPKEFAQELFNLDNSFFKGRQSLLTFDEKNIKQRVYRLIYRTHGGRQYSQLAVIVLFLCFVWAFLTRPLQILWNGGTWERGTGYEEDVDIFGSREETIVASASTISPSGLERTLELVMVSGTYNEEDGYTGDFAIKLSDSRGAELDKKNLDYVFSNVKKGSLHFGADTILYIYDYNADGVNELVTGQQVDVSNKEWREITGRKKRKKDILKEYYLWNIEETSLRKVSDTIYDTSGKEPGPYMFGIPEQTTRVFFSELGKKKVYYVWDIGEKKYQQKELSKEDVKKYRTDYNGVESTEGEINTHTLDTGEDIFAEVKTQKDITGSEVIKQIVLNPGDRQKEMDVMEGYFCDIQWVMASDGVMDRYAVLIYNGINAQTFTIYDLEEQKVYYAHEDGNSMLDTVFRGYNGSSIEFKEGSPAVYTLMEKDGDKLKIGFAASVADGKTVNGTYIYDTVSKNTSNFSYTQS